MEQKELIKDNLSFIQNKSHRLTSALYLVTSFIIDKEPLKWAIRRQVLIINTSIRQGISLYKTDKVVSGIDSLLSLCEVSQGAGYISDMNFLVFKKEFLAIKELLLKRPNLVALPIVDTDAQTSRKTRKKSLSLNRKSEILKIFKPSVNYSIKEISQAFQGLSDKTVQRDLNLLVEEGVIKKTGERRWSRYSLGA